MGVDDGLLLRSKVKYGKFGKFMTITGMGYRVISWKQSHIDQNEHSLGLCHRLAEHILLFIPSLIIVSEYEKWKTSGCTFNETYITDDNSVETYWCT